MSASSLLNAPRSVSLRFDALRTLPYQSILAKPKCIPELRLYRLSPIIIGARSLDESAITHCLNDGWPLSQHPHCLINLTSFPLNVFGHLAAGLACLLSRVKLIPHALTPVLHPAAIRSLIEFGTLVWALVHPVLYSAGQQHEASPQAISGRTS